MARRYEAEAEKDYTPLFFPPCFALLTSAIVVFTSKSTTTRKTNAVNFSNEISGAQEATGDIQIPGTEEGATTGGTDWTGAMWPVPPGPKPCGGRQRLSVHFPPACSAFYPLTMAEVYLLSDAEICLRTTSLL